MENYSPAIFFFFFFGKNMEKVRAALALRNARVTGQAKAINQTQILQRFPLLTEASFPLFLLN